MYPSHGVIVRIAQKVSALWNHGVDPLLLHGMLRERWWEGEGSKF